MAEFDEKLNSLLSNPDAMAQIMQLAQSLGGSSPPAGSPPPEPPPASFSPGPPSGGPFAGGDPLLSSLTGGVHLHTLICPDEGAYIRVRSELAKENLLFTE